MIRFLIVMTLCHPDGSQCKRYDLAEYNVVQSCIRDADELQRGNTVPGAHLWCEVEYNAEKRSRVYADK